MDLTQVVKELFDFSLEQVGLAWWIKIITDKPQCIYYFGLFANAQEAETAEPDYIDDLKQEQAQVVTITNKQC